MNPPPSPESPIPPPPLPLPTIPLAALGERIAWVLILLIVGFIVVRGLLPEAPVKRSSPSKDLVQVPELLSGQIAYATSMVSKAAAKQQSPAKDDHREKLQGILDAHPKSTNPPAVLRQHILKLAILGEPLAKDTLPADIRPEDSRVLEAWIAGQQPGEADKDHFMERHGWFGQLARSLPPHADPVAVKELEATAQATLQRTGLSGLCFVVIGLAALVSMSVMLFRYRGRIGQFRWHGPPPGRGGPFLEAFAIYLLSMVLGSLLEGFWEFSGPVLAFVGFILALLWPKLRGLSTREWRWNLGLHSGEGVGKEMAWGLFGWLAGLPLLGILLLVSVQLGKMMNQEMNHPITEWARDGKMGLVFLLAAGYAPLTEELCFRGLLLSGLRARTSFVLSCLLTAIIFAVIHPQGLAAVPALAGVAMVFGWLRAYRGSVVASVTAHAIHNGLICLIMLLLGVGG